MNLYRYLLSLLLLGVPFLMNAQLSDRVNNPSTLRVGTRPIQGNMGIYFGMSSGDIKDFIDQFQEDYDYQGVPLVSLKYYLTDRWVGRMGFQTYRKSEIIEGEVDPALSPQLITERNYNNISGRYLFSPGVEYHFAGTNLLDVYAGGLVPLGSKRETFTDDTRYSTGEYQLYSREKKTFVYGCEVFIGLQAFIADLPLALGFDFGLAGLGNLKDKYKHKEYVSVGGITSEQIYYTTEEDPGNADRASKGGTGLIKYRDLKAQNFELDGNVRVTITWFFNR